MTPSERFWSRVDVGAADECWEWGGSLFSNGYGYFQVQWSPRIIATAHRYAYMDRVGPVPEGLDLDHLCRNRACCNPAHLEPVTRSENLKRSPLMGAARAAMATCKRGHRLSDDNLYQHGGKRHCRACRREQMRRQRQAA